MYSLCIGMPFWNLVFKSKEIFCILFAMIPRILEQAFLSFSGDLNHHCGRREVDGGKKGIKKRGCSICSSISY